MATAIRFLTETFDTCAKALDAMSPEQWCKVVYEVGGQPVLAQEAQWYAFTHMAHRRVQADVYLRVRNIMSRACRF